jgi:broad specificity phosphatase PhoE
MVLQPSATAIIPTMVVQPPLLISISTPTSTSIAAPRPASTPDAMLPLQGAALVEALRLGGYVIYFRHAATNYQGDDTETQIIQDCSRQGNLNDQGRADARAIGESFLSLAIPLGKVLTSEYCRARDTAMLAFGQAESTEDLTVFPDDLREQRIRALRDMLSTPPEPGMNTVLVAHGLNITNTAGTTLAEGEAAIFQPLGADGFSLVARVLPGDWIGLERLVVGSLQVGPASDPDLLLPDLETLPPEHIGLRVHSVTEQKRIRFSNLIINNGPGPMELWGHSNPAIEKTIVVQQIYSIDDSARNITVGEFVFHPQHDHWHMGDFARYELWSVNPEGGLDSIVALADKVSYCLRDDMLSEFPNAPRFQTYTGCNQKRQGITPGWIDVYKYYLEGQSIDVTHLPNGVYALRSTVNPNHQLWESNYANNTAIVYLEITDNALTVVDTADVILESSNGEE